MPKLPVPSLLLVISLLSCGGPPQQASDDAPQHKHTKHAHGTHAHGDAPLGHRFENAEEWAKRFDDPKRDAWQMPTEVVKAMQIETGMRVADIGAGTGYFLPYLSAAVGASGNVLGLDIEVDMVRYMEMRAEREKLLNVSARVVRVGDPELSLGAIDRILIVDTWHHLPERVDYAKKLAAALSESGSIVIVDFTMDTERGPPKAHRLTADSIVAELAEAGLRAKVIDEPLPDQFIVRATR